MKKSNNLDSWDEYKHPLTFGMTKKTFDLIWHKVHGKFCESYAYDVRDLMWDELSTTHEDIGDLMTIPED